MCKILARSLPTPLSPLHHSPGGYAHPTAPVTLPRSPTGAPYPPPFALALVAPEAAHLVLPTPTLSPRPSKHAQHPPCTSRVPQASLLPLPCTTTAQSPPTRSGHVCLDMLPILTSRPLSVPLVHAREPKTTPAPYWRSRPYSLAR
jgi:hypothetical protein